jgi:hypothetical protein
MAWSGRIDPPHLRSGVYMVYVAQLVECLIVVQEAVGSTPIIHTNSLQRTRLRHMKQGGGMRVVDQNYLCPRSSMEENLWIRTTRWEFESLRGYNKMPLSYNGSTTLF